MVAVKPVAGKDEMKAQTTMTLTSTLGSHGEADPTVLTAGATGFGI